MVYIVTCCVWVRSELTYGDACFNLVVSINYMHVGGFGSFAS